MKPLLSLALLAVSVQCQARDLEIDAAKAGEFVGQVVLACGQVTQVKSFAKGVYLTFGPEFPHEHLTGLVWERAMPAFTKQLGSLERLKGQRVCIRGKVSTYKSHLQIEPSTPSSLSVAP